MPTNILNPATFRAGVWANAPVIEQKFQPDLVALWEYNGLRYDASNEWTLTQATTGTAAISTTVTGALLIDAGATTANQGVNLQALKAGFVPAANKSLWWEACFSLSASTPPVTKWQGYVGLTGSDTTIIASGAQSSNNRLGFQTLASANLAFQVTADKAGTGTTATGLTLADATVVRVGGYFDGAADTYTPYVNGTAGTAIATANIPKVVIYPSIVVQSDGTDRPTMLLRTFKVMQVR